MVRLAVSLLALIVLASSVYAQEKFNIINSLYSLNRDNNYLNKMLDHSEIALRDFVYRQDVSAAEKTVKIIRDYIARREVFITDYNKMYEEIVRRNYTQQSPYLASHLPSVVVWEKNLTRTRDELHKLEKVLELYKECRLDKLSKNSKLSHAKTVPQYVLKDSHLYHLRDGIKACRERAAEINEFSVSHNLTESITSEWIEDMLDAKY